MKKLLIIFVGCFMLWGCAALSFAPSQEGYTPVVISSPEQIIIYRTEKPKERYSEIGVIYSPVSSNLAKQIQMMKNTASKHGGNAIVDLKVIPGGTIGTVVKIEYSN